MCTSLLYSDAEARPYAGRTLELMVNIPYYLAWVPPGQTFQSEVEDHDPVDWTGKYGFLGVTAPTELPAPGHTVNARSLVLTEGLNTAGLSVSVLAFPLSGGASDPAERAISPLQATDLGPFLLSQCANTGEVNAAVEDQAITLTRLALVDNLPFPFHIAVHDKEGCSLVIEWYRGALTVHDNPVGVMTNGPEFNWHLTNLGNWTHLSNLDQSKATFNGHTVRQPDSGIATATLPSSNTSVGRFIKSVYYTNFARKESDPDQALLTLSRIMNNFDRPKDITTDLPEPGEPTYHGTDAPTPGQISSEYTCWTTLTDLSRGLCMIRDYSAHNYSVFALDELSSEDKVKVLPLGQLPALGGDATGTLASAAAP